MINRALIRLKVVQIVYAYYQNSGRNIDIAEKELFFSLSKAYDLYNYLLDLMVEVTSYANKQIEKKKHKFEPSAAELSPSMKFVNNKFILQLKSNKQLLSFIESQKTNWSNETEVVKVVYDKVIESDAYREYMESNGDTSYAEDRELWRKLYKQVFLNNDDLESMLEDMSLYWNDDKEIVDTFVIKTIKRFDESNGVDQKLLPQFKDEEDKEYASRLFRRALLNIDYYRDLINKQVKNWDLDRVAFMDVIVMQIALAEILSFPNIPISVSLNEYVEIAKFYSTSKSPSFINGTLDGIVNQLKKDNKLTKN